VFWSTLIIALPDLERSLGTSLPELMVARSIPTLVQLRTHHL
jgi:hypothetical protein